MIDFELPKGLIAQEPANPRDSARLLVYNRNTQTLTDTVFSELPKFLPKNTTLVLNNSKVEHCRWLFDEGKTELFVLDKLDQYTVRALVRPGKKFKMGKTVQLTEWLRAETTATDDEGIRTLRLNVMHDDARLRAIEHVPLPPYIAQNDTLAEEYQTVYAKPLGSKAAPTAGLHFTEGLLASIGEKHDVLEVTLHVGLGTFASLTDENYATGRLHAEWYKIPESVEMRLQQAQHITTVGTTTTRTLESWAASGDRMAETDIFIQPGYEFKVVNSIITNFHLPGTSLLLMIEAFVGSESEMQRIYDHAIAQKYRFYSFGDAMLIL
ncbi:tRNA preQ1(34) S-adenosylmethionine ribosyltransferase-isomerase QueA [Candidatus Saccharibacteria bacterium]|nr:tRNA preQ1(34) S-adenosylmethionine ribosyltransferase-isomerase QueA [Candidatus Saccharibacteria bacterium]